MEDEKIVTPAVVIPIKKMVGTVVPKNDWMHGCQICDAGLVDRVNELRLKGNSLRGATRTLEKEQIDRLGTVLYPAETLRKRIQRNQWPKKERKPKAEPPFWEKILSKLFKIQAEVEENEFAVPIDTKVAEQFLILLEILTDNFKSQVKQKQKKERKNGKTKTG